MYNDQLGKAEKFLSQIFNYEKVLFMNTGKIFIKAVKAGRVPSSLQDDGAIMLKKFLKIKPKFYLQSETFGVGH